MTTRATAAPRLEGQGPDRAVARFPDHLTPAVNVATVPHLHDRYDLPVILYRVNDSVLSLSNSISVLTRELLAAWRARILCEILYTPHDLPTPLLLLDVLNLFGRRTLELDLIACHDS